LRPCLLENALVGDPPLRQVVSHTYEAGLRGQYGDVKKGLFNWNVGIFHALNSDDIINVASPLPGHQYFQNGGNTLRQGIEVGASLKWDRWNVYANYTRVDATFRNALILSSPNNPFADTNGNIFVVPGDHIPAVPNYRFKAGAEVKITDAWTLGADVNAIGSQYLVGDQSNQNLYSAGLVVCESALIISSHQEHRGFRTSAEPVQPALLYLRDLLPNRFLSLPQSDRSSHLRSRGSALRAYAGLRARW